MPDEEKRLKTDKAVVVCVPRMRGGGAIRVRMPGSIEVLCPERDSIYDPVNENFVCVMRVRAANLSAVKAEMKKYPDGEVEEITNAKAASMSVKASFPQLVEVRAKVKDYIDFAGETETQFLKRKGLVKAP